MDPTTLAAKRVFGMGDTLILRQRSAALAAELGVPIEALDLALVNWARPEEERVTAGVEVDEDADTLERAQQVLHVRVAGLTRIPRDGPARSTGRSAARPLLASKCSKNPLSSRGRSPETAAD